jgi:hypothetical protein
MFKWIATALLVLIVAFIAYRIATIDATNARVAQEIRDNPDGERARKTMLLTLADGTMYPVNYLREDNLVFMGIDGRWWREFIGAGAPVRMYIRGETFAGHAKVVLDRPEYTADIFSRLRPTAPAWLPAWLNGKLVVITPTQASLPRESSTEESEQ